SSFSSSYPGKEIRSNPTSLPFPVVFTCAGWPPRSSTHLRISSWFVVCFDSLIASLSLRLLERRSKIYATMQKRVADVRRADGFAASKPLEQTALDRELDIERALAAFVEQDRNTRTCIADDHAVAERSVHNPCLEREGMLEALGGIGREAGLAIVAASAIARLLSEVLEQVPAPAVAHLGVDPHPIEPLEQLAAPFLLLRVKLLGRVAEVGAVDRREPLVARRALDQPLLLELGRGPRDRRGGELRGLAQRLEVRATRVTDRIRDGFEVIGGEPLARREELVQVQILAPIEQQSRRRLAVAPAPADLLIVGLERCGHVEVEHEANIRLVDAHAERRRRDDHGEGARQEALLR